ncbi:MAG: FG-GAP-like repeat-containing protein [Nanoarchaeota archaeon]
METRCSIRERNSRESGMISGMILLISTLLLLLAACSNEEKNIAGSAASIIDSAADVAGSTSQGQPPPQDYSVRHPFLHEPISDAVSYRQGIILVKFKQGFKEHALEAEQDTVSFVRDIEDGNPQLTPALDVNRQFRVEPGVKNYELKKRFGLDRWVEIRLPEDADVVREAQKWQSLPFVEKAEPVEIPQPAMIPNDPLFRNQWFHENTGSNPEVPPGTPDADIDTPQAWDTTTGTVLVANIEPVEWYHEDLIENIWQNLGEDADGDGHVIEWNAPLQQYTFDPGDVNGIDDDSNGYDDDFIGWDFYGWDNDPYGTWPNGHGTGTAGLLIARGNNAKGLAGVCPNCKLVAIYQMGIGAEVMYAADQGVKVFSWSFISSSPYRDAMDYAEILGAFFVVAAGNSQLWVNGICTYQNALCVAATDQSDQFAAFTSYGPGVDVAAPGVDIWSTNLTNPQARYAMGAGTSASTPIAAGVVALVKSVNPDLSSREVLSILQTAVDPIVDPHKFAGTGRVNAQTAVQYAQDSLEYGSFPIALIDEARTTASGTVLDIYGTADSPAFSKYQIRWGEDFYPTEWTVLYESTTPVSDGLLYSWDLTPLWRWLLYQVQVVVYDTNGQVSFDSYPGRRTLLYQPGWPQETGYIIYSSPAVGDIDGDDENEVVIGSMDGKVYAWHLDGTLVAGWPRQVQEGYSSPALGDIDQDGVLEVVIGSSDFKVYAWHGDGTLVLGWPQSTGGEIYDSPALADIDHDGRLEIVACSWDFKLYAWNDDGTLVPGWPQLTEGWLASAPAVGDIDRDGNLEIVAGATLTVPNQGRIYAWHADGTIVPGWPQAIPSTAWTSPVLGDIDDDSRLEVIMGGSDSKVYAWNDDGTLVQGWPQVVNAPVHSTPALGDIDNDGHLEIVAATWAAPNTEFKVYAWNGDGTLVPGWPVRTDLSDYFDSSPALVDVDNDNRLEIFLGSSDKRFYAWNDDGTLLSDLITGWPTLATGGGIHSSALVMDIDHDGKLEIVVGSDDRKLYIWRTENSVSSVPGWPKYRRNMRSTGLYALACADETAYGECSLAQPLFCEDGSLVPRCQLCNCPTGGVCDEEEGYCDVDLLAEAPVADFTADPWTGPAPLEVQFTDLSTDSDGIIISWAWDFENDGIVDSAEQHPTHTYETPGIYSVNLTVTDSTGLTDAALNPVTVISCHEADLDCNEDIDDNELGQFVLSWYGGEYNMATLMDAVGMWKG